MRLFINGLAASAGGGLTYLRNVIPQIAKRSDVHATVLISPDLRREIPSAENLSFVDTARLRGSAVRALYEQTAIRSLIAKSRADILLSTGNFAIHNSPVPQILLSRNALYTSAEFRKDLLSRGDYALWLDTRIKGRMAKRSIGWADCTIAPSEAFARELRQWTGRKIRAVHHGFDREFFLQRKNTLPEEARRVLAQTEGAVRLLFVSHYNYYRNFETLFKAVNALKGRSKEKKVVLLLTCKLDGGKDGSYRTAGAAAMLRELDVAESVIELGPVPYQCLYDLYRAGDIYVTAAYAETFAHPLVEAMSSGLPIVASDLAVHREICGDAALYFPRFSSEDLASCIARLVESPDLRAKLSRTALERSISFSWERHVDELLAIAAALIKEERRGSQGQME
jgi:glycosyltransferase involved in cell wall biosynthesis